MKLLTDGENHPKLAKRDEHGPKETVIWEFWRAGYERSYHGEPAEIDLGDIDKDSDDLP